MLIVIGKQGCEERSGKLEKKEKKKKKEERKGADQFNFQRKRAVNMGEEGGKKAPQKKSLQTKQENISQKGAAQRTPKLKGRAGGGIGRRMKGDGLCPKAEDENSQEKVFPRKKQGIVYPSPNRLEGSPNANLFSKKGVKDSGGGKRLQLFGEGETPSLIFQGAPWFRNGRKVGGGGFVRTTSRRLKKPGSGGERGGRINKTVRVAEAVRERTILKSRLT